MNEKNRVTSFLQHINLDKNIPPIRDTKGYKQVNVSFKMTVSKNVNNINTINTNNKFVVKKERI